MPVLLLDMSLEGRKISTLGIMAIAVVLLLIGVGTTVVQGAGLPWLGYAGNSYNQSGYATATNGITGWYTTNGMFVPWGMNATNTVGSFYWSPWSWLNTLYGSTFKWGSSIVW